MKKDIEVAAKVIDLLRAEYGGDDDFASPYDVENWATEYLTEHSNLWETNKFKRE